MNILYRDLPPSAQTAYAELFDAARALELHRTVSSLNGSFASKNVKGRTYWYFQYRDLDGSVRQIYVGPDSAQLQALMSQSPRKPANGTAALAKSAIALGCTGIVPAHFRIIRRLAEYGFFAAGGMLVGTHAFLVMANMLGIAWTNSERTQDVDFAHAGKNISIALPATIRIDAHNAIESLAMGFLPITSLSGKPGATYLNPTQPDFRIDFLTTRHRGGDMPVQMHNLNVALQPLKFMEFSLEHPVQAVLFCEEGAVVINIPAPARYALHKLVVFGERKSTYRTKAVKDLRQAAALIEWLSRRQPEELARAWEDLTSRGPGWSRRVKVGLKALAGEYPSLVQVPS